MKKSVSLILCLILAAVFAVSAGATVLAPSTTSVLIDTAKYKDDPGAMFGYYNHYTYTYDDGLIGVHYTDLADNFSLSHTLAGVSLVGKNYLLFRVKNAGTVPADVNIMFWNNAAFLCDFLLTDLNYNFIEAQSSYMVNIPAGFDGWIYASCTVFTHQGGGSFNRPADSAEIAYNPNEGSFSGAACDPSNVEAIGFFSRDTETTRNLSFGNMYFAEIASGDPTAPPEGDPTGEPTAEPTAAPTLPAHTDEPAAPTDFWADLNNIEYIIIGIMAVAVIVSLIIIFRKKK